VSETVLLTGATGFLGMELLARLIDRGEDDVIALVRASDEAAAEARLRSVLARLYDEPPSVAERVRAIPADVSLPGLGLSATHRREVLARTSSIVHCAASIAFDLPLQEARSVNTAGAARVLELAHELDGGGRLRRIVHVSTAYVCGRHRGVFGERESPGASAAFRNSYERSKADGERIVATAGTGLPLAVARPSIVVGDSRCGWTPSFNVVYWPLQAFARGLIEEIPADPDGTLDIVPIDYVADGILALHDEDDFTGTINLVAGERAISNRRLLQLASAYFDRAEAPFVSDGALPGVREADVYLPYFDVDVRFGEERARALLDPRGIACPPLERYFSTLMDFAARTRWGKRAPTRQSTQATAASVG
jgi:nucleoside-diphosphate-sugar epimerase